MREGQRIAGLGRNDKKNGEEEEGLNESRVSEGDEQWTSETFMHVQNASTAAQGANALHTHSCIV